MEVLVGAATLEAHLNVLFVLGKIWGSLLEINHGAGVLEGVIWQALGGTQSGTLISVKGTGKVVTVINMEHTVVEANVDADVQVLPGVGFDGALLGNEVTLKEDALRNTRIGDTGLQNMDSVILKVVIHSALTEAVILIFVLNNSLLEVAGEVQNLTIVFKPFGCNTGNRIVNMGWTFSSSEGGSTLSFHALEETLVHGFLQVACLFSDDSICHTQNLGLVVTGQSGVRVGHAR